jgi:hypothetical protein
MSGSERDPHTGAKRHYSDPLKHCFKTSDHNASDGWSSTT